MDEDEYREPHAGDDPVAAFERLRGEVSLLRHAVEGLTAARENIEIPDYEPTLERTEKILVTLVHQIDGLSKKPAMTLTPETMGQRLNASMADATAELRNLVNSTRGDMNAATRDLQSITRSRRDRDTQDRWLIGIGLGSAGLAILLYALIAAPIARWMPDSWLWPERGAMRALGEPTMWDAGAHLMARGSPASWDMIVAANPLADGNRETLQACREAATKAKKPVRCTIEVKADNGK